MNKVELGPILHKEKSLLVSPPDSRIYSDPAYRYALRNQRIGAFEAENGIGEPSPPLINLYLAQLNQVFQKAIGPLDPDTLPVAKQKIGMFHARVDMATLWTPDGSYDPRSTLVSCIQYLNENSFPGLIKLLENKFPIDIPGQEHFPRLNKLLNSKDMIPLQDQKPENIVVGLPYAYLQAIYDTTALYVSKTDPKAFKHITEDIPIPRTEKYGYLFRHYTREVMLNPFDIPLPEYTLDTTMTKHRIGSLYYGFAFEEISDNTETLDLYKITYCAIRHILELSSRYLEVEKKAKRTHGTTWITQEELSQTFRLDKDSSSICQDIDKHAPGLEVATRSLLEYISRKIQKPVNHKYSSYTMLIQDQAMLDAIFCTQKMHPKAMEMLGEIF